MIGFSVIHQILHLSVSQEILPIPLRQLCVMLRRHTNRQRYLHHIFFCYLPGTLQFLCNSKPCQDGKTLILRLVSLVRDPRVTQDIILPINLKEILLARRFTVCGREPRGEKKMGGLHVPVPVIHGDSQFFYHNTSLLILFSTYFIRMRYVDSNSGEIIFEIFYLG